MTEKQLLEEAIYKLRMGYQAAPTIASAITAAVAEERERCLRVVQIEYADNGESIDSVLSRIEAAIQATDTPAASHPPG